jgi:hypothetical protein
MPAALSASHHSLRGTGNARSHAESFDRQALLVHLLPERKLKPELTRVEIKRIQSDANTGSTWGAMLHGGVQLHGGVLGMNVWASKCFCTPALSSGSSRGPDDHAVDCGDTV